MRILLPVLLAISGFAMTAPARAETRTYSVTSFTKVRVQAPFKVRLATGVSPFARASGSSRALQDVSIRVEGETLVIGTSQSAWGGYPGKNAGPVEISVGTHDLRNAALNGAGMLDIDRVRGLEFTLTVQGAGAASIGEVAVDRLLVGVVGTGHARLAGRAKQVEGALRGLSSLDAAALNAKSAKFVVDGASSVSATVTERVKVTGAGTGALAFAGNPACELKLTGTGMVSGCR